MATTVATATATASNSNGATPKKCPPSIRTGSVPAPVLVSPISVAHGSTMVGSEGAQKGGANWMRDQWVANLKKKRMTGADGELLSSAPAVGPVPVVKAGIRAEASRPASAKPAASRSKRATKSKIAAASSQKVTGVTDMDSLSLMNPANFFNDLGCFELESPSFMRLTPTMSSVTLASPAHSSFNGKSDKKWMKPLMKKRGNCFSSDTNEPKRRTPRRPNSANGTFDDSDTSSQHSYSSVGTPSNFRSADGARMWGPDLDFPTNYIDTFLDLPTPRGPGMPSVTTSGAYMLHTPTGASVLKRSTSVGDELDQPKLVRTTSIEQEGLSHFLEQTNLGGSPDSTRQQQPSSSKQHSYNNSHHAAANAVDEFFGKTVPSPAHYSYSTRCLQPTPKGTMRLHPGRDYNFDLNKPLSARGSGAHGSLLSSEFDTLAHEYEFTDFDQELDNFYLDTMDSFGNDLDLISS